MNFNPKWLFLIALAAALVAWCVMGKRESVELGLSSGKPGAGYQKFAHALADVLEQADVGIGIEVKESEGGVDNFKKVDSGECDLGLVQLGWERSEKVKSLATVYSDVVQVLARTDSDFGSFVELAGHDIAVGLPNSGTRRVSELLLNHYGMDASGGNLVESEPVAALQALLENEVDAMILVTELRAPVILQALESGKVKHIRIAAEGAVDGLCSGNYNFEKGVISTHTYAKEGGMEAAMPRKPIEVIKVPSQLVCRADLDKDLVFRLTKAIFENRDLLEFQVPAVKEMEETSMHGGVGYRLHPGAAKFYKRRDPGFLVVYAEVIALLLSAVIALVGLVTFLRKWWSRKLKNRIDVYYEHINRILIDIETHRVEDFEGVEFELMQLRHKAFDELVKEKLPADDSFLIFQRLLEQCMRALDRERVREKEEHY